MEFRVLSADPEFLTLRIRCNIPTADRLQHFFEELKNDLDPEERSRVAMAFREMLLNAIEHGGKLDPSEWVRVSRVRSRRSLVYHMEDPGKGFSRSSLDHAALANSEEIAPRAPRSPQGGRNARGRLRYADCEESSSTKSSITKRATR